MIDIDSSENGNEHKIYRCPLCGSIMDYDGLGNYVCGSCGVQEKDDYALVRDYIDKHGMKHLAEISEETGVSVESIQELIDDGRFEMVVRCAGCGIEIKSGMYCPNCRRQTLDGLSEAFKSDIKRAGTIVQRPRSDSKASMRFVKPSKKDWDNA